MQSCQVCGTSFDPLAFQVVVPELGRGFDRVECARSARALALGAAPGIAPLVAIVEPVSGGLTPVFASGPSVRPFGAPVATLGLLAAGTAAAVFLWLRVLGVDTAGFPFLRSAAPPAFGHETVKVLVQPRPPAHAPGKPAARPTPEPVTALIAARRGPVAPAPAPAAPQRRRIAARPSPPVVSSPQPAGHHVGNGHIKHGETDGTHTPGHGHHGKHGNGKSHGNGKGKGKH